MKGRGKEGNGLQSWTPSRLTCEFYRHRGTVNVSEGTATYKERTAFSVIF